MAEEVHNQDIYKFTRPMMKSHDLDFSYAGLKTAFLYFTKNMGEDKLVNEVKNLASSYQEAAFGSITKKVDLAIKKTRINRLVVGGGVAVNKRLRYLLKNLVRKHGGTVFFPSYKYLNFDNAAMIGVVANYIDSKKYVVRKAIDNVDRLPRMKLSQ
jgi:N6-L-threonylcarbamoyladenine synthase